MALWTFLKNGVGHAWKEDGATVSNWDDGLAFMPGEDGFTTEPAAAKAAELGKGVVAAYAGTPNWHARIEQEAADAEAAERKARIAAHVADETARRADPVAHARNGRIAAINAHFDAMAADAPELKGDIEALRGAAIAEVDAEADEASGVSAAEPA